jgi:hypothetical protein
MVHRRSLSQLPVGFQNSAIGLDLGFYAARSYLLRRPPRTGRRLIRFWETWVTGVVGPFTLPGVGRGLLRHRPGRGPDRTRACHPRA